MDLEHIKSHIQSYRENDQILDAAEFLIRNFGLDHENFGGFGFREEVSTTSLLLTAEGALGEKQQVMIPKNLFDFDLVLVANMMAHEMLHVRQKAAGNVVEDKNEREFQAYHEMLFHEVFPQIPEASDFHKKQFGGKALEYYRRMGEASFLQKKYAEERLRIEKLIESLSK